MLMIISPAKSLDFESKSPITKVSQPVFETEANRIASELRNYSESELAKLMKISTNLSTLNRERFLRWTEKPAKKDIKQAILAFTGEVFRGLQANTFTENDFDFAQNHLRILSGMYGVLSPLDGIQPYRLEMGTKLKMDDSKHLYDFWGDKIRKQLEKDNGADKTIINLASNEYFKSIQAKHIDAKIITPVFKDLNKGELKVVTVYAKNARGQMVNFILKNRIEKPEDIKAFDVNGYEYADRLSDDNTWTFVRS